MHHVCDKQAITAQVPEAVNCNVRNGMWRHVKTSFSLRYVAAYYYVIIDKYTEMKCQLLWLHFCLNILFSECNLSSRFQRPKAVGINTINLCIFVLIIRHANWNFLHHIVIRWPIWICCTFSNYLVQGTVFGKYAFNMLCVLLFFTTPIWNVFYFAKNSVR